MTTINQNLQFIEKADGGKSKTIKDSDMAKIIEKSQEFEAVFLSEMYKPMFESIDVNENFGGGKGEEMFRSLLRDEYAKELAKTSTLGIADLVKEELIKMQSQANQQAVAQNMQGNSKVTTGE